MMHKVVTNNLAVAEYLKNGGKAFRSTVIEGSVRDVVFTARGCIMQGWRLCADPLAGRRVRANPFLTVILEKEGEDEPKVAWNDVLRVEQLLDIYYKNQRYLEGLSEVQRNDYRVIDSSLTEGVLEKLSDF